MSGVTTTIAQLPSPLRGYVICATQRSGSNYLCQILASTGVLGHPLDYFNGAGRRAGGEPSYPDDVHLQLDEIASRAATANGIYGFKLLDTDFSRVQTTPWIDRFASLRFVYLHRLDTLGQAISLVRAEQTGAWRSTDKVSNARYDASTIASAISRIEAANGAWQTFFQSNGLSPLDLCYEDIAEDPQRAANSVASTVDLGLVNALAVGLAVQRDATTEEWRARYTGDPQHSFPAASLRRARPRLSVHILTKDAENRLPRLLGEVTQYADEVVVGVDVSSSDSTWDVAASSADKVYRFRLPAPGLLAPARMLALDYATGDWILSLDDDEGMDEDFDLLLPDLLSRTDVTHFYFRRKWILSVDPPRYIRQSPWYPNWARRMFKNDRTLVWKPPIAHSQYYVMGQGMYEERACMHHFEPVISDPEDRKRKVAMYHSLGAPESGDILYQTSPYLETSPVKLRSTQSPRRQAAHLYPEPHELTIARHAPWSSEVVAVSPYGPASRGAEIWADVTVRNTGKLAWLPTGQMMWPQVRLGLHTYTSDGTLMDWDAGRAEVQRRVMPGELVVIPIYFNAPSEVGRYELEWDMLNENECWFAACGATTLRSELVVCD